MADLKEKNILLGVCGGIAAYKTCEILRRLTDLGAQVHVVMTKAAREFISPLTFQSLSRNPVHTDLFNLTEESEISHIALAEQADLVLISPVTANLIAKLAYGLADDLLSTLILVTQAPVLLAPSMNDHMWGKEVVKQNIQILKKRGFKIIEPGKGYLACGSYGKGRLAEPEIIVEEVKKSLKISKPSVKKKASPVKRS
jgi:phosphopantothenoylcysteine decarboxylase/phosphopantothenate--cysteine ligase